MSFEQNKKFEHLYQENNAVVSDVNHIYSPHALLRDGWGLDDLECLERKINSIVRMPTLVAILEALLSFAQGMAKSRACKVFRVDWYTFSIYHDVFKTSGINGIEKRLGRRAFLPKTNTAIPLLVLSMDEKKLLMTACEKAVADSDKNMERRCNIVLAAEMYFNCWKLANDFGYCTKAVKKWIKRYEEWGINGLSSKKTGPKKGRKKYNRDRLLDLLDSLPDEGKKWNNKKLAIRTGQSEATVEKLLTGVQHPNRRSESISNQEVESVAIELGFCLKEWESGNNLSRRMTRACVFCGRTKRVTAHTIFYDRNECRCKQSHESNCTEKMVVEEMGGHLGIQFEHRVWPDFLRLEAGKSLQLDGYWEAKSCSVLPPNLNLGRYCAIAIEFQGPHHYKPTAYRTEGRMTENWPSVERHHWRTVENDKIKREACEKYNVLLICVPYFEVPRNFDRAKISDYCFRRLVEIGMLK